MCADARVRLGTIIGATPTTLASVNECMSAPCINGATCTDELAVYSCACVAGYTGEDCGVEADECASAPCKNGGQCRDLVDSYECKCAEGFTGKLGRWARIILFILLQP